MKEFESIFDFKKFARVILIWEPEKAYVRYAALRIASS